MFTAEVRDHSPGIPCGNFRGRSDTITHYPFLHYKHFCISSPVVIPSTILTRLSSGNGTIHLSDVTVPRYSLSHISLLQLLRPC